VRIAAREIKITKTKTIARRGWARTKCNRPSITLGLLYEAIHDIACYNDA
jgi:hypothetical protein